MKTRFLIFFLFAAIVGWGQTTIVFDFTAQGYSNGHQLSIGNIDSNIDFTGEQNSTANPPAYYTSDQTARFYYASNGNGNSITLHPKNNTVITEVELTALSGYTPNVEYNVDGGADISAVRSNTTYTLSGFSASASLKIRNSNLSNTQLRLRQLKVTYVDVNNSTACFTEDFASTTSGDNTTTSGSSAQWDGGGIWQVDRAYQAGGAVRLGANAGPGFIQTTSFVATQSTVELHFDVKGWTTVEGDIVVTLGAQTHTFSYTARMADPFETVSHTFTGVPTGTPLLLRFETTARRAFLDNIILYCVTPPTPEHFRSRTNGPWSSSSTWESSEDGATWDNATTYPDASAISVKIRNGHTVIINTMVSVANTEVENGGSLEVQNSDFDLIGSGYALTIKNGGSFIVNGNGKPTAGTGKALVEAGGIFKAVSFSGSNDFVSNYLHLGGANNKFRFEDQSIFSWEAGGGYTLGSTGFNEIFWVLNPGDLVIYRMTNGFSGSNYGGGTNNLFHAVLELNGNWNLNLAGSGNKIFEGGIIGTGNLNVTYSSGTGKLILGLNPGAARLGDSGNLKLILPNNKLELNNATVPTAASVTIESGGGGNPNTFARTGGDLIINGLFDITHMRITNTASGGININSGGTLRTSFNGGLYGTNVSSAISSGTLNLNNGNTVEYYGGNQTISNLNYYHLKLSGAGIKTPQGSTSVHTNGSVSISGTATVDYSGSNLASTAANNTSFTMDGGRLILGTTGTQPNMQGAYTLTGGVVEFANTNATVQTIRNSPIYKYQNIEITGTNVGASSGNTALKPNGSFIVKTGGIYTVRQNAIKCYDDSPTGTAAGIGCSVVVEDGALFRTGNDKGFAGYESEVSSSSSAIDITITDITLEDGSTVEYLGEKSQEITKDELTATGNHYYNLVVSGELIEPVTGELKVENVLTLDEHDYNSNHFEGKLIIAETTEETQPHVLYANKGVQINKGKLILETNAQLMQDADAVNTGDVFVERKVRGMNNDLETKMDYIYWSSPVIDQDLHSFSSGTPVEPQHWGFLEYNEETDYFDNTLDNEFKQAKGYAIRAEDGVIPNDRLFEFTGVPQNGQIDVPVTHTSEERGFNLIGNPYPSNIDVDKLFADNSTVIYAGALFWTNSGIYEKYQQGSGYEGNNYALYNLTGGIPGTQTGEDGQEANPNGIVKVGQGFLVKSKQPGPVLFKNTQRDTDAGSFYSKKIKDRYRLTLTSPSSIINTTLIGYVDGATDDYDPDYDADYWGSSDGLYSIIPNQKLIIQGRQAPFDKKDRVQLGTDFFENGVYIIALKDTEGIFTDTRILLRDKQLNVLHNLKKEPYKFYTLAGEVNDRFEIIYQAGFSASSQYSNLVTVTAQDEELLIFSEPETIESLKVYNLAGRLIYEQPEVGQKEFRVSLPFLQKQILVVHVFTASGKRTIEKVIFK